MSLRNVLDGTIKVGGGGGSIGPDDDVECNALTAAQ